MTSVANPFAAAWDDLARRETLDRAERIFGLWSAEAAPFYVFVLRPDMVSKGRIMEPRKALIDADIRHVVSRHFLHITVQSLGNVGDGGLTEQIADDLAAVVADAMASVAPFTVRLRGVSSFGAAAFVAVHEEDGALPLQTMQRTVVDALLRANRVPVRHPERPYVPHLSICYYDRPYPAGAVLDALALYRHDDFGCLPVRGLDLVRIVGNGALYPPMETVRHIPFEGAA